MYDIRRLIDEACQIILFSMNVLWGDVSHVGAQYRNTAQTPAEHTGVDAEVNAGMGWDWKIQRTNHHMTCHMTFTSYDLSD